MSTAPVLHQPAQKLAKLTKRQRKLGDTAARLERLSGYDLTINYRPDAAFSDDRKSRGYLLTGYFDSGEEDFIHLDARKGQLRKQLVKELQRISRMYRKIARRVKGGAA